MWIAFPRAQFIYRCIEWGRVNATRKVASKCGEEGVVRVNVMGEWESEFGGKGKEKGEGCNKGWAMMNVDMMVII